jgi:putative Mg2+ transporter-C (MgtC) family protein
MDVLSEGRRAASGGAEGQARVVTAGPADELVWALRIVLAAVAGAAIGAERELHSHPAGMRTHLLVSVGSAAFTILSMHGFSDVDGQAGVTLDPSRVAAQIVAGIGFIGGGAILKYGVSIRGLTTAGSLWATAAVGFAFGSGLLVLGTALAAVILFSLWPMRRIVTSIHPNKPSESRFRLGLSRLETLQSVYECLVGEHVVVSSMSSRRLGKNRYEVELRAVIPQRLRLTDVEMRLGSLTGVEVLEGNDSAY